MYSGVKVMLQKQNLMYSAMTYIDFAGHRQVKVALLPSINVLQAKTKHLGIQFTKLTLVSVKEYPVGKDKKLYELNAEQLGIVVQELVQSSNGQ